MALKQFWLNYQDTVVTLISSAAYVTDGVSSNLDLGTVMYGADTSGPPMAFGILLDITAQGGTQASVDIDLEFGYGTLYTRVCRYNSVPGDGTLVQMMLPTVGAKPLPIGGTGSIIPLPLLARVRRTFNTPGGTPTITFSVSGIGWGYRNHRAGSPGMR